MGRTVDATTDQWDRFLRLAQRIGPADWSRPTPARGLDVRGLMTHVGGAVPPTADGTPPDPLAGVRAGRDRQVRLAIARDDHTSETAVSSSRDLTRDAAVHPSSGMDLWVHSHDLRTALGEHTDLEDRAPAVINGVAWVSGYLPRLFAAAAGRSTDRAVRVRMMGAGAAADGVVAVRAGNPLWLPLDHPTDDHLNITPAALLLLLSGRVSPAGLRDRGALEWSGAAAQLLVQHTRLPG